MSDESIEMLATLKIPIGVACQTCIEHTQGMFELTVRGEAHANSISTEEVVQEVPDNQRSV